MRISLFFMKKQHLNNPYLIFFNRLPTTEMGNFGYSLWQNSVEE
jgi:hypothetical protein